MDKHKLQINTLTAWTTVYLAPSEIHGVGVFAICDLPKDTKLFMDIMPQIFRLPREKWSNMPDFARESILARWPNAIKGEPFVLPDARYVAYCNHSEEANYDAKNDVALRDIKKGEEITENYKLIDGWQEMYPFMVK